MLTKEEEFDKFLATCKPSGIAKDMPDLSNDPLVLEKGRKLRELLKKSGLPEEVRIRLGLPENWQEEL